MLLALDLSTNTGWACGAPWVGLPKMTVGTWKLDAGTNQERARMLARKLAQFIDGHRVELAVVEIPQAGAPPRIERQTDDFGEHMVVRGGTLPSQNLLWALNGAASGVLASRGIPVRDVGVKEWRKAMLGNGNIKGVDAKRRSKDILRSWQIDVANQDEAEAGMMLAWLNNHLRMVRYELGVQNAAGETTGRGAG